MQLTRLSTSGSTPYKSTFAGPSHNPPAMPSAQLPEDSVTLSGGGDHTGWKIAGITTMLFALPVGVAAKSLGAGALVGLAGLGLMFGPDL